MQGNNMKATLFGDECDHFKKVFEHKKKYEIANAPVKIVNPKFSSFPGECELTFGGMTKIQHVDLTEGPVLPEYIPIADVPKTSGQDDRFDLLGVVVHMEDVRQVTYQSGRVADVRDINIVDERPMIISAWGQLATSDYEILKDWASSPLVLEFLTVGTEPVPITLDHIINKTVDNTVQEEVYTITVTIPDAQLSNVIAYIGCDGCANYYSQFKSTDPRPFQVNFTFDAVDNTRTFRLTAFSPVCEQLLQLPTIEIFERKIKDDWSDFDHLAAALKNTPMHIILHPAQSLNRAGVLRWVVQSVSHP
uniref:Replication protein A OB domain-containing protein n=1 Tax=Chenopodium quinoa TaxID=63459 RepID=A0A803MWY7_CHEQI